MSKCPLDGWTDRNGKYDILWRMDYNTSMKPTTLTLLATLFLGVAIVQSEPKKDTKAPPVSEEKSVLEQGNTPGSETNKKGTGKPEVEAKSPSVSGVKIEKPIVLKLGIESGKQDDHGRDSRIFTVPVSVGDASTNFTWGCGGQTIISAWFAKTARIEIRPNEELNSFVDGDGKRLFVGDSSVEIKIGNTSHSVVAWIMRDGQFNKNVPGIIGYQVARQFQWEIDPRVPQITLRNPGTKRTGKSLATVPLKEDQENFLIHVKVRNAEEDVVIMPQTPDFQVAPALQKSWDMDRGGGAPPEDIKTYLGTVRMINMKGNDGVRIAENIFESNFPAYLLSDNPNARSAIGQSILNRYVYVVDPGTMEMTFIEKAGNATTAPAKPK